MPLRLAQASSSEIFTEYGQPPNQRRTGVTSNNPGGNMDGEANLIQFYGGWSMVFRAKDPKLAENIAWMMTRVVMNGKYGGYGQNSFASDGGRWPRTGLFDALMALKKDIPDPMDIKTLFNFDCSSSAGAVVYHSGVKDKRLRDMNTYNEESILMSTGKFDKLTDPLLLSIGTGLKRGDILLKPGHTAIAIDSDDHYDSVPYFISNCFACNLRKGPGIDNGIVTTLYGGKDIVNVLGFINDWGCVCTFDGKEGYVSDIYLCNKLPSTRAKNDVWLRTQPGIINKETEIIVIQKNEIVYLTGEAKRIGFKNWKKVVYANHMGWVSGSYLM